MMEKDGNVPLRDELRTLAKPNADRLIGSSELAPSFMFESKPIYVSLETRVATSMSCFT